MPQHAIGSPVEDQEPSVLEADYASLKHLTTELQAAIKQANRLTHVTPRTLTGRGRAFGVSCSH